MMRIHSQNIYFVLVEPESPGNIGAAARALKTMGFRNFLLVNPADHLSPESGWMAHRSQDILKGARVFPTLQDAITDMHTVVATTQRERVFHLPYYTPKELAGMLIPESIEHKIALVFGREKTGLTNTELSRCDMISTIPARRRHPSLNLAQAVMIYCYELYQAAYGDEKKYHWRLARHRDLEILYRHLRASLEKVGFEPIDNWENFTVRFSRLMGRANAEVRDVKLWHKIIKTYQQYIQQLEKDLDDCKKALNRQQKDSN